MPAEPTFDWVDIDLLIPNPWNPNAMDATMFGKAIESIHRFGFVDPVTVREIGLDKYQIIDGEHRVRAAKEHSSGCSGDDHVGLSQLPITNLGMIEDHVAKQLTIVLNETRGEPDQKKLGLVLIDLIAAEPLPLLTKLLPFTQDQISELAELPKVDWNQLEAKPNGGAGNKERWVERVYRVKADDVHTLDEAIQQASDDSDGPGEALIRVAEGYLNA